MANISILSFGNPSKESLPSFESHLQVLSYDTLIFTNGTVAAADVEAVQTFYSHFNIDGSSFVAEPSVKWPNKMDDISKISLLYFQMQRFSRQYSTDQIQFRFLENDKKILRDLAKFYKNNRHLIPSNVRFFLDNEKGTIYSMKGSGATIKNYEKVHTIFYNLVSKFSGFNRKIDCGKKPFINLFTYSVSNYSHENNLKLYAKERKEEGRYGSFFTPIFKSWANAENKQLAAEKLANENTLSKTDIKCLRDGRLAKSIPQIKITIAELKTYIDERRKGKVYHNRLAGFFKSYSNKDNKIHAAESWIQFLEGTSVDWASSDFKCLKDGKLSKLVNKELLSLAEMNYKKELALKKISQEIEGVNPEKIECVTSSNV